MLIKSLLPRFVCLLLILLLYTTIVGCSVSSPVQNALVRGKPYEAISHARNNLSQCKIEPKHNLEYACYVDNYNALADIYRNLYQYDRAIYIAKQSTQIAKKSGNRVLISNSLQVLSFIYLDMGLYEESRKACEETLAMTRDVTAEEYKSFFTNSVLSGTSNYKIFVDLFTYKYKINKLEALGSIYAELGLYQEALDCYDQAINRLEAFRRNYLDIVLKLANTMEARLCYRRSLVYNELKEFNKSEALLREMDRLIKKAGLKLPYYKKDYLIAMSNLFIETGRYDSALKYLSEWESLNIAKNTSEMIVYYTQKGEALKRQNKIKDSSFEFLKAVTLIETMRSQQKKDKGSFIGTRNRVKAYRGIVSTLAERVISGEYSDPEFNTFGNLPSAVFYFSESTKDRNLVEAIAESKRESKTSEIPTEIKEKEKTITEHLNYINKQWDISEGINEAALKQNKEIEDKFISELNEYVKEIRNKYPRYAALHYPKPMMAKELPLKDNEVILEYSIGDDASYLICVSKGEVKKVSRIPLGRKAMEEKIQTFLSSLSSHKSEFSPRKAKELYTILLADAFSEISETDKVIIVPDGILSILPFEALVIKEGANYQDCTYVGDIYNITYSQSMTALALNRLLKPPAGKKPLFALGNPIFDNNDPRYAANKINQSQQVTKSSKERKNEYALRGLTIVLNQAKANSDSTNVNWEEIYYPPLPETEEEITAIAKLFGVQLKPPDILLGIMANETQLKASPLSEYRYLHFATHADLPGKIQGINEPFLLLSQVENKKDDNGFLTLTKVLDMKLDADMVVLSACVTAKGRMIEGEGVANFVRAFQHAGARSVVVSHWYVPSLQTVDYMKSFYDQINQGKTRADAMKSTRLDIKKKHPHPYFWAVFVLYGEG